MDTSIFKYGELPEFKKFTPENISKQFPVVLEKIAEDFKNIEKNLSNYLLQNDLSCDKVINPLYEVNEILRWSWGVISHLNAVNNSESLRDIYSKFLPEIISLSNKFGQSKIIYNSLVKLKETNNFDQIKNRILDKEILEMKHRGISLQKNDQEEFNKISEKLGKLSTDFSNNVLDATNKWFLILNKKSEVDGLPERVLELMAISAHNHLKKDEEVDIKNGPWKLSLDIPTYTSFMTYATDRNLRERLYKAFVGRASQGEKNNSQIIEEILSLRTKKANLLGYKSWAELSLSTKMAKEIKNVENLLEELREPAFKTAKIELETLDKFSKANGFPKSQNIEPWDISYWSELLRKEKLNLDQESLRPWFPLNDVLKGLFKLSEKLFEIKVVEATDEAPLWNDDVLFFNIFNKEDNKIASFYLDPYSRPESKRGGAWMDECLCRNQKKKDDVVLPVAYLVCNQTPPIADKPSLMSFEEVETLFHEFGHGLQHMLTTVNYPQAAGINNVEWDAVELASQFMENWCLEDQTISEIAIHWKTKEALPESEINKLRQSRTFNSGLATLRQIHFALTDLKLHSQWNEDLEISPDELRREIAKNTTVMDPIPEDQFLCAFSHIFAGGYAAGYYSYKWAEVLSSDAFAAFEEAGLANHDEVRKIGKKYRDSILSLGGSRSPNKVFKQFRGRLPSTEALIRHSGLN